jgi:hypothetical protein
MYVGKKGVNVSWHVGQFIDLAWFLVCFIWPIGLQTVTFVHFSGKMLKATKSSLRLITSMSHVNSSNF